MQPIGKQFGHGAFLYAAAPERKGATPAPAMKKPGSAYRMAWPALLLLFVLIFGATSALASGVDFATFESKVSAARAALQKGDYEQALADYRALLKISPDYPDILLGLARSEAGLGNPAAALENYRHVVQLGLGASLISDPVFTNLRTQPGYKAVFVQAQHQARPIVNATTAFTLPERNFIPESMAYDAVRRRFFVSSTYLRKIVSRDRAGHFHDFATAADTGMWQVLGLKIDERRGWLIACSGADSQEMIAFRKSDLGKSGVFIFDLQSGRLVGRYDVSAPGMHLFNDLVIGVQDDVYVTDSDEGSVYKLDLVARRLQRLTPTGSLIYPNGITLSPDGTKLYVAEEGVGIDLVNTHNGAILRLPHPKDITTVGIDGLYFHKGYLIATQTDIHPNRVMAFRLSSTLDAITGASTLERGDSRMRSPTEGVVVGDTLYFIANSQQNAFDNHGDIWPDSKLVNTQILKLALPGN